VDDCFDEPAWPLVYAIGWVIERDRIKSKPYADRSSTSVWAAWHEALDHRKQTGNFIEPCDAIAPAWKEVRNKLIKGELVATGRPLIRELSPNPPRHVKYLEVAGREPIPPFQWIDYITPVGGGAIPIEVMVMSSDVLKAWPAQPRKGSTVRGKRGPNGNKTQRAADQMLIDLCAGKDLESLKQEDLARTYKVRSRATAVRALGSALSKFRSPANSDN
jgi:hypothetical protein